MESQQSSCSLRLAHNVIDLTNQVFTRWAVVARAGRSGGKAAWLCRCECGTEKVISGCALRKGTSRSCGCLQRELLSSRNTAKGGVTSRKQYKHEFGCFVAMRTRCTNQNIPASRRYCLRGIAFCEGMSSFDGFFATLGPSPTTRHSIDRIDNDGGYWCGLCTECKANDRVKNVRWATQKEQGRNTSRNALYEINGTTKCIAEGSEVYGADEKVVSDRMCRGGWDIVDALTIPSGGRHSSRKIAGDKKRELIERLRAGEPVTDELAAEYGVKRRSLFNVIYRAGLKLNIWPGPRDHKTSVMSFGI